MKRDILALYQAIVLLENESEADKFFRDLLTEAEIKEFVNRWKAAKMLDRKESYEVIVKETGLSSATIARVSKWLIKGKGGYRLMLKRLKDKQDNVHHRTTVPVV